MQIALRNPFAFGRRPAWNPVFNKPVDEQMKIYRDPAFRESVRGSMQNNFYTKLDVHYTEHADFDPAHASNTFENSLPNDHVPGLVATAASSAAAA